MRNTQNSWVRAWMEAGFADKMGIIMFVWDRKSLWMPSLGDWIWTFLTILGFLWSYLWDSLKIVGEGNVSARALLEIWWIGQDRGGQTGVGQDRRQREQWDGLCNGLRWEVMRIWKRTRMVGVKGAGGWSLLAFSPQTHTSSLDSLVEISRDNISSRSSSW